MIRRGSMCTAAIALVVLAGCNRVAERSAVAEAATPVGFDLEPVQSGDGSQQWIGVYRSAGKTARFKMDLGVPESTPVKSGEGTLLPETGSDASALLIDLQKALRAKTAPVAPAAKSSVPFTYFQIGDHLSQGTGGEFRADPAGDWTALRLVFGDGDKESEIFLHLNASTKKGQFSMKDPRYGDLALAEMAKAL